MKKLKQQYKYKLVAKNSSGSWYIYPTVRNCIHKQFSTKEEKSFYFVHLIECKGFPIKLRAARGTALADPWDDYPTDVYAVAKSWKHNSKRKRQYYR